MNEPLNMEIYEGIVLTSQNDVPQLSVRKLVDVSQLQIIDLIKGDGRSVKLDNTLEVNYLGIGGINGYVFDSSFDRQQTADFPLRAVIQGWQDGLLGMREGGRRVLIIPANQAYGNNPPPGSGISQNETLIFLVDLIKIS